jgi:hypothetical protein
MLRRGILVTLLCIAAGGPRAFAQDTLGTITGMLYDPNEKPLTGFTGALLTARNSESGRVFTAPVQENGEYTLSGLPVGTYDLTIPLPGAMYLPATLSKIVIKAGVQKIDLHAPWGMNLGTIGDDPDMLGKDMRRKANVSGPTPRMPDGKPDLSGMWSTISESTLPDPYPLKPWAAEIQNRINAIPNRQNPGSYCLPQAATPFMAGFPHKLIQTPDLIVHLTEFTTPGYRQIFLDGRPHPEEWNPSWMGHSVGHWEGDTLVVDTVGFNELTAGFGVHSEKLHVVERITRPDKANLVIEIIADDVEAYTGVWKRTIRAALIPGEEILEFVCAENNKDPLHFGGLGWADQARPKPKQ